MELRTLLKILKRYWYLVILPPVLVGAVTLVTYRAPAPGYASTLRFSVGYAPEQQTLSLYDRKYPAWLTSEYIAGGLSDWAKTGDFAQAVAGVAGGDITAGEVAGSLVSDHLRSIVVLYLNGSDPDRLTAIGNAAIKVLQVRNNVVFPQNGEGAVVRAATLPASMTMLTAANAMIGRRSSSPWTPLNCIRFSRGYHAAH